MNLSLIKALEENAAAHRNTARAQANRWVYDAVKYGLLPFKPNPVNLYLDFDLDYQTYRILIEFPSVNLRFKLHVDRDLLYYSDTTFMWDATCTKLFNMIRYRETLPVPDNIALGEN